MLYEGSMVFVTNLDFQSYVDEGKHKLAKGVATGVIRSMIVSGAPGVGKSFTLEQLLEDYTAKGKTRKYRVVRGMLTPINLYKLLWGLKQEREVLVLDDSDSIFYDDVGMSLLKAALDTGKTRRISYFSEAPSLKAEGIETEMLYEGSMVFVTNLDFQSYVDQGKHKLAKHFEAFMSRSNYLDLKLHTKKDLLAWISHMVSAKHILVQQGMTRENEAEALSWVMENADALRELSSRTVLKVGGYIQMDPSGWKSLARTLMLR
jgi:hypothetical protein